MLFVEFLFAQLFINPPSPAASLTGQTIIITGGNRGLGFEAANHVVSLGAKNLVLGVRSPEAGEKAKATILKSNPGESTSIEVWPLDLTSYASVRAFARRAQSLPRIDAVLQNAGISTQVYTLAEDNEKTITVNVVSTFLLSILLLPKLRLSGKNFGITPRITIVGSEVHGWTAFKERYAQEGAIFKTLNDPKSAHMKERYFLSKLLVMLCVRELAAQMDSNHKGDVVVNCPAPGFVRTGLDVEQEGSIQFQIMQKVLARDVEVGSRCLVDAMSKGKETHGKYLSECRIKKWVSVSWISRTASND